jgi:hypothetical protein
MERKHIANAIQALAPGGRWVLRGDTLEGLEWLDQKIARPGEREILAKAAELAALPDRRPVPKSLIVMRLNAAGKLAAASSALNADIYARERWYAPDKPAIYADDPEALALLEAIGADAEDILAPQ